MFQIHFGRISHELANDSTWNVFVLTSLVQFFFVAGLVFSINEMNFSSNEMNC